MKRGGDARLSAVGSKLGATDAPSPPTAPLAAPPAAPTRDGERCLQLEQAAGSGPVQQNGHDAVPMPQRRGLKPEHAFIAVSALRGTNLGHMWTMVAGTLGTQTEKSFHNKTVGFRRSKKGFLAPRSERNARTHPRSRVRAFSPRRRAKSIVWIFGWGRVSCSCRMM